MPAYNNSVHRDEHNNASENIILINCLLCGSCNFKQCPDASLSTKM